MKSASRSALFFALLVILPASNSASAASGRPFPQHTTYASGTIAPNHFTQGEKDQHVRNFYDSWKSNYLVAAGTNHEGFPLYRVAFGRNSPTTVSEGQGYGMVITALMAGHETLAQQIFDGLWRFSRTYPSGIDSRLMTWLIRDGAIAEGNDSAFDGDADIAYGLLLAHEQWGSDGDINYFGEAIEVMDGMMASTIGPDSMLPTLGDWVGYNDQIWNQYAPRSSDFMPSHFRAFAIASQKNDWNVVTEKTQDVIESIQSNYSSLTGLLPDFIVNCQVVANCEPVYESYDPINGFLEDDDDGDYGYNAGRVPWRIGLDVLLNDNQRSRNQLQKIITWLSADTQGDPKYIAMGYRLDGTPLDSSSTSTFFIAPFAVALMSDASQQAFLNSAYTRIYNQQEDYFEDSVNLLSLIALTGNYWQPGMGSPSLPACSDGIDNDGDALVDMGDPGCEFANDTDETDPVIITNNLTVSQVLSSDWGSGYCNDVTVSNAGNTAVTWDIKFRVEGMVSSMWSAEYQQNGQQVSAQGVSWNSVIKPNASTSFGYCANRATIANLACSDGIDNDGDNLIDLSDPGCTSTDDTDETDPVIVQPVSACSDGIDNDGDNLVDLSDPGCTSTDDVDEADPVINPNGMTVRQVLSSDWGSGYCNDVIVSNTGSTAVTWDIIFTVEGAISSMWSAQHQQTGQQVSAQGIGWNSIIQPNASTSFGYCANL